MPARRTARHCLTQRVTLPNGELIRKGIGKERKGLRYTARAQRGGVVSTVERNSPNAHAQRLGLYTCCNLGMPAHRSLPETNAQEQELPQTQTQSVCLVAYRLPSRHLLMRTVTLSWPQGTVLATLGTGPSTLEGLTATPTWAQDSLPLLNRRYT